jgi:hypothetical protein
MPGINMSKTLFIQKALFNKVNPAIKVSISMDQSTIVARNISESDFKHLELLTNSLASNEGYFYFKSLDVYLGSDLEPTQINGLNSIVFSRVNISDALSNIKKETSHMPFENGFTQKELTIGELIDNLAELSDETTPQTKGIPKKFTLVLDPPASPRIDNSSITSTSTSSSTSSEASGTDNYTAQAITKGLDAAEIAYYPESGNPSNTAFA